MTGTGQRVVRRALVGAFAVSSVLGVGTARAGADAAPAVLAVRWAHATSPYNWSPPALWQNTAVVVSGTTAVEYSLATGAVKWQTTIPDPAPCCTISLGTPTLLPDRMHIDVDAFATGGSVTVTLDARDGSYVVGDFAFHSLRGPLVIDGSRQSMITGQYGSGVGPYYFLGNPGGAHPFFVTENGTLSLSGSTQLVAGQGIASYDPSQPCVPLPIPNPPPWCASTWHSSAGNTRPTWVAPGQVATTSGSGVVTVLDLQSGATLRQSAQYNTTFAAAKSRGNQVFVGGADGRLRVFDSTTMQLVWSGNAGGAITQAVEFANGKAYVATTGGRLVTFAANGCGAATCAPLEVGDAHLAGVGAANPPKYRNGTVVVTYGSTLVGFAV